MDHALLRFREAAARQNGRRPAIRRRYSPGLRQQAVEYCQGRVDEGESVRQVASALGVAAFSLQRWMRQARRRPAFQPVTVVPTPHPAEVVALTVTVTPEGARVDGLDVDTAARLLRLLR
jgi:transposase-like protein